MEPDQATSFSGVPPIVLLVDQYGQSSLEYRPILEAAGMWVTASGVQEALHATDELRPDVVVADADFDEATDGYRFVAGLGVSPWLREIPLITLTDSPSLSLPPLPPRDVRRLVKPVLPPVLLADIQQVLLQGYATRLRSDRDAAKSRELAERARALIPEERAPLEEAPEVARYCPHCGALLAWVESAELAGDTYDYYRWCENQCGLFCYARRGRQWIKLIDAATPGTSISRPSVLSTRRGVRIVTTRDGAIEAMEADGAALLNISVRHARRSSLLRFFVDGRLQLAHDLRRVGGVALPPRAAMLQPKDRRPRRVRVSLAPDDSGVLWTIEPEVLLHLPHRRSKPVTG